MSDRPTIDHLVRSKRKTIALVIRPDGALEVRAPLRMAKADIDEFIRRKTRWIRKHQEIARQKTPSRLARHYREGEPFLYLGHSYPLEFSPSPRKRLTLTDKFILPVISSEEAAALFEAWYRAQAREVFEKRLQYYSQLTGLTCKKVRISSARTRWGSCSTSGTISFTWRLVMAPQAIIDYVVVHELAHTHVHNHGPDFWAQVRAILPDYAARRAWLKVNGALLDLGVAADEKMYREV